MSKNSLLLYTAVADGAKLDKITQLLQDPKDPANPNFVHPDLQTQTQQTILHRACYLDGSRDNNFEISRAILNFTHPPIDPTLKDKQGNTAFHVLIQSEPTCDNEGDEVVKKFLKLGFNPAEPNNKCATPFSMVSAQNRDVWKILRNHFDTIDKAEAKKRAAERKAKKELNAGRGGKKRGMI